MLVTVLKPDSQSKEPGSESFLCYRHILHTSPMQWCAIKYKQPEILTTVKNGNYDGLDMWSDQVTSVKRSCKAQYRGKGKEEGKIKDGRITSENGPA